MYPVTLKAGDRVSITEKTRDARGERIGVFVATVIGAEEKRPGPRERRQDPFIYFGYLPDAGQGHGHWGCARYYATPSPFGIQSIQLLEKR